MTFGQRLRRYAIGIGIGLVLSYLFLGDRLSNTAWMPKDRVKDRLQSTLVKSLPAAETALSQKNINLEDIRSNIQQADIDLRGSTRTDDSIYYKVDCAVKGNDLKMTIAVLRDFDLDSTATLMELR